MDAAGYTTLTRQSGLMREMQVVANNIANISTTGFRREGVVFAEYVKRMDGEPSLSMAHATARNIDLGQASISQTGGAFDFAIQGDGFFLIETPQGQRLTRAGSFTPSAEGELVNPDGFRLLDQGGAPIFVPPDAGVVGMSEDGTLSAGGQPLARVGLWQPTDPNTLRHQGGTLFEAGAMEPVEDGQILQGYIEDSNVNPISEIARMIEVQRAYELGQKFLDNEDARVRGVIQTLGR
ncbi:flagellar hook-basal body complex protein [Rhodobacter ferrooxidans]|uniref:Flagellar basal-body rod protein FlgF n=1 Tax=Rhodobacter ferrooxidans TaxID=371731 RepID=C8RX65_9RHOB|nr:flagellar hook-basal body complex protein [Rhodobacter sp. SW2]EEW26590.1 flagellar basal-body rod protein FlgF [Rhodobacter sp. SW2]